jgi:hypothetical protein
MPVDARDRRRYLFLMRHAEHRDGHLTVQGSDHVRAVADRLMEWVDAEWRFEADTDRRIRLWYTTTLAPEVLETVDLLTFQVAENMRRQSVSPTVRIAEHPENEAASDAHEASSRRRWMAARLPPRATDRRPDAADGQDAAVVLSAYSPQIEAFRSLCTWLTSTDTGDLEARAATLDAPLLVGNDPLIGWLTSRLVGRPTPVARGELVCLVREPKKRPATHGVPWKARSVDRGWRLWWTLSDDGDNEAEAVRAKIKSKMSAATGLGAVIVGLTTFLLQRTLQEEPSIYQWLAFAALGASAVLYFESLFLYDSLQMPVRFWGTRLESRSRRGGRLGLVWARLRYGKQLVRRPPSSSARLLQASMLRVWVWIFTPATLLAGVGVAVYALAATPGGSESQFEVQLSHVLLAMSALAVALAVWIAWHRPNLGASD